MLSALDNLCDLSSEEKVYGEAEIIGGLRMLTLSRLA